MISHEEFMQLSHLIDSLEEAYHSLEYFYVNKDIGKFNETKKFILEVKNKIDELLK
ncbi:MAG: hypothetical protein AABW91_00660 [Nanoarchaeota archaeon]